MGENEIKKGNNRDIIWNLKNDYIAFFLAE